MINTTDKMGPGDALEELLASHGITKEWYCDFKDKYGLLPICNCKGRQEWLNRIAASHPNIEGLSVKLLNAFTKSKSRP